MVDSEIKFGGISAPFRAKNIPKSLEFIGFIPTDHSIVFDEIIAVYVGETSFLKDLSFPMLKNGVDALLVSERDYLLRVSIFNQSKVIFHLCAPSQPIFHAEGELWLNLPDFHFFRPVDN